MSSSTGWILPDQLLYSPEPQSLSGQVNYVQFTPFSGYKRLPSTNQNFLKISEGYGDTTILSVTTGTGKTIYHPIRSALFEQQNYLPLPFVGGGMDIDIQLSDYTQLLTTTGGATGFSISNVSYVGCMLSPSPSYLQHSTVH